MMLRPLLTIACASSLVACSSPSSDEPELDFRACSPHVTLPGDVPTIADALDEVCNGGTIELNQDVTENVLVDIPIVTFVGMLEGDANATVTAADNGRPVFEIGSEQQVQTVIFENVDLRGGRSGILAHEREDLATNLYYEHGTISGAGIDGGIIGFADLVMEYAAIKGCDGPGVDIVGPVELYQSVQIRQNAGVGVRAEQYWSPVNHYVHHHDCVIEWNGGGGVELIGDDVSHDFDDCSIWSNTEFGVRLIDTDGITFFNSNPWVGGAPPFPSMIIGGTFDTPSTAGTALVAIDSTNVTLERVRVDLDDTFGIFAACLSGSTDVYMQENTVWGQPTPLAVYEPASCSGAALFHDLGGNDCDPSNGSTGDCHVISSQPSLP